MARGRARQSSHELRFAATQLRVWAGRYGVYLFIRSLAIEHAGQPLLTPCR
jgi:hypothetical protein